MRKNWFVAAALWSAASWAQAGACVNAFELSTLVGGGCEPTQTTWETVRSGSGASGGSWVYAAAGSVSLPRGTIGAHLQYTTVGMDGSQPLPHVDAKLSDVLTFGGPGPAVDVTFEVAVLGAFVAAMPGTRFDGRLMFKIGAAEAWMQMANDDPAGTMAVFGKIITAVPEIEVRSNLPEDLLAVFRLTLPVATGVALPMSALLQLQVDPMNDESANADFSHTASLAIHVPDGWHYTSGSGALLVPEPPAALLMVFGVAALALRRRRR